MLNRNQTITALAFVVALLFIISAARVRVLLGGAKHENKVLHVEMSSNQFKELKTMVNIMTMLSIVLYSISLGVLLKSVITNSSRENIGMLVLNFVVSVLVIHASFKVRAALCKSSHNNGKMTVSMSEEEHKSFKRWNDFLTIWLLVMYSISVAMISGKVILDMTVDKKASRINTPFSRFMDNL